MYDLRITELADADLDAIIKYISLELANPQATKSFLDKLEAAYQFLSENPRMYPFCEDRRLASKEYRKVLLKNYVLIYRIAEAEKRVYLLRFFYGAQDYINQL